VKVAVYLRDEFTDAHREQIAVVNDGARLDRLATRNEIKEFYETYGNQWRAVLETQFAEYVSKDLEDLL
jgi:PhoPQ-activated pathogenicity-related protein